MKFILIITLVSTFLFGQNDKSLLKGLDLAYNFQFNKAEDFYNNYKKKNPTNPFAEQLHSNLYLWSYLSNNNQEDYSAFINYSDKAIEKAEDQLKLNSNLAFNNYILGTIYCYRTIAFGKAESFVNAIWASKKASSYLETAIEIDSTLYDAYFGLGLFNVAMAQVPSAFRWVLSLAGLSGDEKKGVEYIKIASQKGNWNKIESQFFLSQIMSDNFADYKSASDLIKPLINKFPSNLLFRYSLATVELKKRNLNESLKSLMKLVNKKDNRFTQIIAFSNFLVADIYFRKLEVDSSIYYYSKFLSLTEEKDYKGIANFRMALLHEFINMRAAAEFYYGEALKGNLSLEDDIFAKRKAEFYRKNKPSTEEIIILKAQNLIEAGKFNEAKDSILSVIDDLKNEKLKAEAYYWLSEAYYFLKNYNESYSFASLAISMNPKDEKWIKPFSQYNASRALLKIENFAEAEKLAEQSLSFDGYDYQNKLKSLIKSLQIQINSVKNL